MVKVENRDFSGGEEIGGSPGAATDPALAALLSDLSAKVDELLELEKERDGAGLKTPWQLSFLMAWLTGAVIIFYAGTRPAEVSQPVAVYTSWSFRLLPEAAVILGLAPFVASATWALVKVSRESRKVRIKVGDRLLEYRPGVSREEFDRLMEEAIHG